MRKKIIFVQSKKTAKKVYNNKMNLKKYNAK